MDAQHAPLFPRARACDSLERSKLPRSAITLHIARREVEPDFSYPASSASSVLKECHLRFSGLTIGNPARVQSQAYANVRQIDHAVGHALVSLGRNRVRKETYATRGRICCNRACIGHEIQMDMCVREAVLAKTKERCRRYRTNETGMGLTQARAPTKQ